MTRQRLGIVPSSFLVEHVAQATFPEDDEWVALVRAPEGLTVVREAPPWTDAERWVGYYGTSHGLDTPGMLAAVIGPLAADEIPVFVASTFHADLVLVPERFQSKATQTLQSAGHQIIP